MLYISIKARKFLKSFDIHKISLLFLSSTKLALKILCLLKTFLYSILLILVVHLLDTSSAYHILLFNWLFSHFPPSNLLTFSQFFLLLFFFYPYHRQHLQQEGLHRSRKECSRWIQLTLGFICHPTFRRCPFRRSYVDHRSPHQAKHDCG